MTIALVSAPSTEPLSLNELKEHLRIDHDHEDSLINELLIAARQYAEFTSGQKFITQQWRQYESCLPDDRQVLVRVSPIQVVSEVTAFDRDGQPTVLAATDISLIRGSEPPLLKLSGSVDPALAANGLEIDIVVGMGDLAVDIPQTIKRAILLLVAHWYEFRGAVSPQDQPVSLPPGFDTLMAPFRGVRL